MVFHKWGIIISMTTRLFVHFIRKERSLLPSFPNYLFTYSTQQSPPWEASRFSAIQEIPRFSWNPRFITAFTNDRYLFLSWARSVQSMPNHPTSLISTLILSFHLRLGLPSCLFPSCFPTKILYAPPPIRATCSARLNLLDLITRMILSEEERPLSSSIGNRGPEYCNTGYDIRPRDL